MIGVTLVDRFGQNLNSEAGIPALQLTNEVFGRGSITHLTELYYSQKLFDNTLELKGGRLQSALTSSSATANSST